MAAVSAAARTIAWIERRGVAPGRASLQGRLGRSGRDATRPSRPASALRDGEVHLDDDADPAARPDPRPAGRHGRGPQRGCRIDRTHASTGWPPRRRRGPIPWPAGASDDLVALLLEGHDAIPVLESLDQRGPARAAAARVGAGPVAGRSATPTTASPSTGTCGRRRPTPPSSPTGSRGPTSSCSARSSTTSARGTRATTPRSASSWSSASGTAHGPLAEPTSTCWPRIVRHHLLLPDVATRRDLTDDGDDRARWPRPSAPSGCSTCWTR